MTRNPQKYEVRMMNGDTIPYYVDNVKTEASGALVLSDVEDDGREVVIAVIANGQWQRVVLEGC